jgi:hypothetical protein
LEGRDWPRTGHCLAKGAPGQRRDLSGTPACAPLVSEPPAMASGAASFGLLGALAREATRDAADISPRYAASARADRLARGGSVTVGRAGLARWRRHVLQVDVPALAATLVPPDS